ncbi:nucleotidyltransferase family protein [Kitasatospora sp. NPDC087314]|uniref:nucleotidyltransferase family protein n=1 Tax=Kitasatospora sp. NPDC087314 TaxID=3364068 RepID=UPI003813461C
MTTSSTHAPTPESGWTPRLSGPDGDVRAVLLAVAEHQGLDHAPDDIGNLLRRQEFDHGRLIERALRHKLGAALADYVHRHGLRRSFPVQLRVPLLSFLQTARHRATVLTAEAARVSEVVAEAGIAAAWTKGVVAQERLYDGRGVRQFNDMDLMIRPEDRDRLSATLLDAGFTAEQVWDSVSGRLLPRSRTELRIYKLSPDHLPHFHRIGPDPVVPVFVLDVANSLTWHGADWQVPMDAVLAGRRSLTVGGVSLPALSAAHSFLFVCLHLFREGWVDRFARLKGANLSQVAEVLREWRRLDADERASVVELVAAHRLARPVAWACGHTDRIFGTSLTEELGVRGDADAEWLGEATDSLLP